MIPLLRARATHLYPGARGVAEDGRRLPPDGACLIAFSDGVAAPATLSTGRDGARLLDVGEHVTARGARIAPKRWLLEAEGGLWRVRRRMPST